MLGINLLNLHKRPLNRIMPSSTTKNSPGVGRRILAPIAHEGRDGFHFPARVALALLHMFFEAQSLFNLIEPASKKCERIPGISAISQKVSYCIYYYHVRSLNYPFFQAMCSYTQHHGPYIHTCIHRAENKTNNAISESKSLPFFFHPKPL